ncbi:MAG: hypothetical protein GF416_05300 [Candidatus Altiarchaeales archaeon]|nr:hypothetical protein [Candidatus Altiarchaeales archaeon]MBD3416533.1 hypothetical protein [Candidatus Altiarchaeales archaeon]
MASHAIGKQLLDFMIKWSGRSGALILVNELKKMNITDVEHMTAEEKEKLMTGLTANYLSTFLGHSRFLVARSELVSILGLGEDSYRVHDRGYKKPRSPNLFGKPEA